MKTYLLIILWSFLSLNLVAQEISWIPIPGPEGGNVSYLGETADHTLYMGDLYQGSLWVYNEPMASWEERYDDNLGIQRVLGIAENRIYVLGNSNGQTGLYYSDDYGQNWISSTLGRAPAELWIASDNTLYVMANDTLYRSDDEASSWVFCHAQGEDEYSMALSIDDTGGLFYTHTHGMRISGDKGRTWDEIDFEEYSFLSSVRFQGDMMYSLAMSARDGKLYRSQDDGNTWEGIELSIEAEVHEVWPHTSGALFARTYTTLHISLDQGDTWQEILTIDETSIQRIFFKDENQVYVITGNEMIYSSDLGQSWQQGELPEFTYSFYLDHSGTLYAMSSGGIMRTLDQGKSWHSFNTGYRNQEFYGLIIDGMQRIYARQGSWQSSFFVRQHETNQWTTLDSLNGADLQRTPEGNLVLSLNEKLYYSSDHSKSWKQMPWDDDDPPHRIFVGKNNLLAVVTIEGSYHHENIHYTYDFGQTWQEIELDISDGDWTRISSFHITPDSTYFIATMGIYNESTWYRSVDKGVTIENIELRGNQMFSRSGKLIMIGGEGFFISRTGGVFASDDNGDSWDTLRYDEGVYLEVPNYYLDNRQNIYSLVGNSLSVSYNDGVDWQELSSDPINGLIKFLTFSADNNLYCQTRDTRIFRASNIPMSIEDEGISVARALNYPNPFSGGTTIVYSLEEPGKVAIGIYDLSGKLVNTLPSLRQSAGKHEIHWDRTDPTGKRLNAGTYFIKISTETFTDTIITIAK